MPPGSLLRHPVQVRALNYLETVLSVIPTATDRLESWFARPVVKPPATGLWRTHECLDYQARGTN